VSALKTGLDILLAHPKRYLKGTRIGLVCNHTSLAADGRHSWVHAHRHSEIELTALFAPEHGLYGVAQDMETVNQATETVTGLPIHSLYGEDAASLIPDPALFADLDAVVFDIQDIGARYYTFIYTMANCMTACKQAGVRMVVCDRPNPINGVDVEGNLVGEGWHSFVGQYSLPNRHGMTTGELARLFNEHFEIGCELEVVAMEGWNRAQWYDETGLPWVAPSPNMPTLATATVYSGMCLVEGTQMSEGRGTTSPFEHCGEPGFDAHKLARLLNEMQLPGVQFRPQIFKPMFQKHARQACQGVFLQITDRTQFKPVQTGLAVVAACAHIYPVAFAWRIEPYEFVSDRLAIDLLYGNSEFREQVEAGAFSLNDTVQSWQTELDAFKVVRQQFLMY